MLTADDILPLTSGVSRDQVDILIEDTLADASQVNQFDPQEADPARRARLRSILRRAILRRIEAGAGGLRQRSETRGPVTQSETVASTSTGATLSKADLADIAAVYGSTDKRAYSISTIPSRVRR